MIVLKSSKCKWGTQSLCVSTRRGNNFCLSVAIFLLNFGFVSFDHIDLILRHISVPLESDWLMWESHALNGINVITSFHLLVSLSFSFYSCFTFIFLRIITIYTYNGSCFMSRVKLQQFFNEHRGSDLWFAHINIRNFHFLLTRNFRLIL